MKTFETEDLFNWLEDFYTKHLEVEKSDEEWLDIRDAGFTHYYRNKLKDGMNPIELYLELRAFHEHFEQDTAVRTLLIKTSFISLLSII